MKNKIVKYMLSTIMIGCMMFAANHIGDSEIIFPEVAALVIGAWTMDKCPWKISRIRMVVVMTIGAFAGIGIGRYVNVDKTFQILIGFIVVAVLLTISKTTMVPAVSACILPIMIGTKSIVYPIAVFTMVIIVTLVWYILEKVEIVNKLEYTSHPVNYIYESQVWVKRLGILAVMMLVPALSGEYYFIAPPLIVTFVEFSKPSKPDKDKLFKVWILIIAASIIGVAGRSAAEVLGISTVVTAIVCMIIFILLMETMKIKFPPAGAIMLLPLLLKWEGLLRYPLEVAVGSAILIFAAVTLFYVTNEENAAIN